MASKMSCHGGMIAASTAGSTSGDVDAKDTAVQVEMPPTIMDQDAFSRTEDLRASVMAWLQNVPNTHEDVTARSGSKYSPASKDCNSIGPPSKKVRVRDIYTGQIKAPELAFTGAWSSNSVLNRHHTFHAATDYEDTQARPNHHTRDGSTMIRRHSAPYGAASGKQAEEHGRVPLGASLIHSAFTVVATAKGHVCNRST